MNTKVEYSYVIWESNPNLPDGTPKMQYNEFVRVNGFGTVADFIDEMKSNSTDGLSIIDINYRIVSHN